MEEIKCNELPQETTLTNTLKLIGNSDNKIKQIGVDLLRDYVTSTLQGQIDIIQDYIGNLNDLSTTQKDSLVNAVKEVDDKIDVLNTGISTVQSDITELNSALDTMNNKIYSGTMSFIQGIKPNGANSRNIVLPKAFKDDNYQVILTINSTKGNIDFWTWAALRVFAKTEEMFTVWVSNNHSTGAIPEGLTIDWIAIHS